MMCLRWLCDCYLCGLFALCFLLGLVVRRVNAVLFERPNYIHASFLCISHINLPCITNNNVNIYSIFKEEEGGGEAAQGR